MVILWEGIAMNLRPRQNITLEIAGEPFCQRYVSTVDSYNNNEVVITAPILKESVVPIRVNTKVIVEYTIVNSKEQGRYRISGTVTKRTKSNNVSMLAINLAGKWTKIQLRDHVRVDVSITGVIDGKKTCLIRDLSGGGALCVSKEEFESGSEITVEFEIDNKIIQCEARIVRCIDIDDTFQYGLTFINLDETTRKDIIQFVYQRQLDNHRKLKKAKFKEVNDG